MVGFLQLFLVMSELGPMQSILPAIMALPLFRIHGVLRIKYQVIDDAISNALRNGRSGKGCVVVFASGNDYQSTVGYPANCNPEVIAVGAISSSGMRASFSNYGSALDVVAPGEDVITTTTNSGYSSAISGTSFACPLVARGCRIGSFRKSGFDAKAGCGYYRKYG